MALFKGYKRAFDKTEKSLEKAKVPGTTCQENTARASLQDTQQLCSDLMASLVSLTAQLDVRAALLNDLDDPHVFNDAVSPNTQPFPTPG